MPKQPSQRKTGLTLNTESGPYELLEYSFPESRKKFNVFVDGVRTQAACTEGVGKAGDVRHYTYIKYLGDRSMYVKEWIEPDSQNTIA